MYYAHMLNRKTQYVFDSEKNKKLKEERGVNFEDAILAIADGKILGIRKHPNLEKYPKQWVAVLQIENYAYQMPFIIEDELIFLKTIYASRKATKFYLKNEEDNYEQRN